MGCCRSTMKKVENLRKQTQKEQQDQFERSASQQPKRQKPSVSYSFQFFPNNPDSLTMTKYPAQLAHLLVTLPIYILISDQDILPQQVDKISKDFPSKFLFFQQISILKKFLLQQKCQNVRLLCPLSSSTELQAYFSDEEKVKKIYCYGQCEVYKQIKLQGSLGNKFANCASNLEELTKLLIENTEKDYLKNEYFNFIDITDGDAGKSNTQVSTMYAMVNQHTNEAQLIDEMIELARLTGFKKEDHFEQFRKDLLTEQPNQSKIVQWYTKDSFVYRLVNSLLGTAEHPSEMYCLQPYIKRLFRAIRSMHKKEQFTCFRGAFISQTELYQMKNKNGLIVQNLSYMSTSLDFEVAQRFASNALFIIHVAQNGERHNGFASVSKHSVFRDQAEILFNPLNFFQVIGNYEKQMNGKKITLFEFSFAPISNDLSALKKYQKQMSNIENIVDVLIDSRNMEGYQKYLQKHGEICKTQKDIIKNMRMRGFSQVNAGRYQSALQIFLDKEELGDNGEGYKLQAFSNIAKIYCNLGQYSKSLECYNKCEQIIRKSLGISHPEYVATLSNIASIYNIMRQSQKSLQNLKKCEQIILKSQGISHPYYEQILSSIASVYYNLGQYSKSLEYYNKSEQNKRKSLGISHPKYAESLNNIGNVYAQMGQDLKSLQYFNKCKQIMENSLGIYHPSYATAINNIGNAYCNLGQYQKSLEYYSKSEQIIRKSLGTLNPTYALNLHNIGKLYLNMGKYSKSLQYLNKSEQIMKNSLGVSHPNYGATIFHIGNVYFNLGQYSKSLEYYRKYEQIIRTSLGTSHPDYSAATEGIANVYCILGQYSKSLQYYKKSEQIIRNSLGTSHPYHAPIISRIIYVSHLMQSNSTAKVQSENDKLLYHEKVEK